MYYGLVLAGYYLPSLSSAAITSDYLFQVATNKCFRIDAKAVKFGQILRSISKEEILHEIKEKLNNISLGFTDRNLPDKAWAINILKTLEPKHILFANPKLQEDSGLTQDDLMHDFQFEIQCNPKADTSIGRNKRMRYFRRTKDQVKAMRIDQQKNKKQEDRESKQKNF